MRRVLFIFWLLVPVAAGAYHYGPGQDLLVLDDAAVKVADAEALTQDALNASETQGEEEARPAWDAATEAWEAAVSALPDDRVDESRRARLELAKAKMHVSKLPEAHADLAGLLDELTDDADADDALTADTRQSLANAHYYMTWLMRLEGAGRERWEPEVEAARQHYKLLAQRAESTGDEEATRKAREDLEAAVRLARMDLTELQGLPLPSQ